MKEVSDLVFKMSATGKLLNISGGTAHVLVTRIYEIENITVSEGLSEHQVRAAIQKVIQTLDKCFSHAPNSG